MSQQLFDKSSDIEKALTANNYFDMVGLNILPLIAITVTLTTVSFHFLLIQNFTYLFSSLGLMGFVAFLFFLLYREETAMVKAKKRWISQTEV